MNLYSAAMIRHLLLIRHAKSDWNDPALSDFERPLSARGEHDVPIMGERLATSNILPERIISSPARRAKSTAKGIARHLALAMQDIEWRDELYLASPATMLDAIRNHPDHVTTLFLVGHNPGISALADQLCGNLIGDMPTCGIAHLTGEFNSWKEADSFRLVNFDYPKRQA